MAFNLADVLRDVSDSGTALEQIQYIPLTQLDEDPGNFYQLSDIPELADNISLCGLQQPIRVRQKEDGRYIIVSGHRRRAALEMLVADGYERFREAACIVERDEVSPALQQLRLIYANASTRKMTAAETAEEAERVTDLLYTLKEEGYEFPGRMRDHVAQAMSISKSKLARLKVIRENLDESWVDAWKDGSLTEAQAYELAQMPKKWQLIIHANYLYGHSVQTLYADRIRLFKDKFKELSEIECQHGLQLCEHCAEMMKKNAGTYCNFPCNRCCFDCFSLQTCKDCCPEAMSKKKELRAVAKQANLDAKREQEERDRPGAEFAKLVWYRIGKARKKSGCSMDELHKARGEHAFAAIDVVKQENWENGKGKYGPDSPIGFGYALYARDLMRVAAVADALSCSLDWLLGRTDDPESHLSFREPEYPFEDVPDSDAETMVKDVSNPGTPINSSCITGISPSGHCGAAACCDSEHTCCLQCGNTSCNSRCGWIDDIAEEI